MHIFVKDGLGRKDMQVKLKIISIFSRYILLLLEHNIFVTSRILKTNQGLIAQEISTN